MIMSFVEQHQEEIISNESPFREYKILIQFLICQSPKDLVYCYSKISIPNPCLVLYM